MKSRFINLLTAVTLGLALLLSPFAAVAQNTTLNGNILLAAGTVQLGLVTSYTGTLNNKAGKATTESNVVIAGTNTQAFTITSSAVAAADICYASVNTTGTGQPFVAKVAPAAGSLVVTIGLLAGAPTNASLVISFVCFKP